jgi:hemerythrin-like domain-containing protein
MQQEDEPMPAATQVLRHEHDAVVKMLGFAEDLADRLDRGERVGPGVLDKVLEFFRIFVDRCHHGKEEDLLFPLLEAKGMPRIGGPLGVMLGEHEEGRKRIKEMAEAAEAYRLKVEGAGCRWADAARSYAELLRAHIGKENNVLFEMAERMLTPDEQASLAEAFEKLEVEKIGAGKHEQIHAMMAELLAGADQVR